MALLQGVMEWLCLRYVYVVWISSKCHLSSLPGWLGHTPPMAMTEVTENNPNCQAQLRPLLASYVNIPLAKATHLVQPKIQGKEANWKYKGMSKGMFSGRSEDLGPVFQSITYSLCICLNWGDEIKINIGVIKNECVGFNLIFKIINWWPVWNVRW